MKKRKEQQPPREMPRLWVEIPVECRNPNMDHRLVRARIVSRHTGPTEARYLQYREGPTVRNHYLGTCTPRRQNGR